MSVDRGVEDLPEAGSAPLIIDAEFTEVEDKGMPTLDAVDEISIARARTRLSCPNQDLLQRVELGLLQSSIRKEGLVKQRV